MYVTPLGSPSLTDPVVSEFHPAAVVVDQLLPVVGVLFAVYLLALFGLFLVTVAFKLTGHQGAHHPLGRRTDIVLPATPALSVPVLTAPVPAEPVLVGGAS